MLVKDWLKQAGKTLQAAGVGTARLDALILLEDVTARPRAWLLAHPESGISPSQASKLTKLLKRRAAHEPLAYIRGRAEFYGREFVLTSAVLQPRPESETMIDLFKQLFANGVLPAKRARQYRLADVGTGSGALGITAQLELPKLEVDLIDIDAKALQTAKTNVDKFTLSINVIQSDLLTASDKSYDLLLCNLPYIPDDYQINLAAAHEPRLAIFGGQDGLELYRKLFQQIKHRPHKPLYILTESLPPQHAELCAIARSAGYKLIQTEDFIQVYKSGDSVGS